jgi:hypothetical protein
VGSLASQGAQVVLEHVAELPDQLGVAEAGLYPPARSCDGRETSRIDHREFGIILSATFGDLPVDASGQLDIRDENVGDKAVFGEPNVRRADSSQTDAAEVR